MKRFLRRKQLAERYGFSERTIDRMIDDGRLPKPDLVNKRSPLWAEDNLTKHDRAWAASTPHARIGGRLATGR